MESDSLNPSKSASFSTRVPEANYYYDKNKQIGESPFHDSC